MRVLSKRIVREFWQKNPDSKQQLKSWFSNAEKSEWQTPNQVKEELPQSRLIPGNRVIFNLKGNHYRIVVKINYKYGIMWIRFIGTHNEYDKIDPTKI